MIVPSLVWHTFGAYNVVIIITYIRRGLRVVVPTLGQCEGLNSWNDNCRIPRFFMPCGEGFGWILSLLLGKIGWFLVKFGELV